MKPATDPDAQRPITHRDELRLPFERSERPRDQFLVGIEMERFGVSRSTHAPLGYDQNPGVLEVFAHLIKNGGWQPLSEVEQGPVVALERGRAQVTLEPGAQLEFSGSPWADLHQVGSELRSHLEEVKLASGDDIAWLATGFHPWATQNDLPWVPKQRYSIMREYLPRRGHAAWDMMRRTATVQLNLDYADEQDALQKLTLALRAAPWVNALFANSPFREGELHAIKSYRGQVWLNMDPDRSGLIESLWGAAEPGYDDYIDWALDAGMFLFKREGKVIDNSGQPFREFLEKGFGGYRATLADWRLHLNTLFPEARLKNTLEVRSADCVSFELSLAVAAVWLGLLADSESVRAGQQLFSRFGYRAVEEARSAMVEQGLEARVLGVTVQSLGKELIEIASSGLERRRREDAGGRGESLFLEPIRELLERGLSPADVATRGLARGSVPRAVQLQRTELVI